MGTGLDLTSLPANVVKLLMALAEQIQLLTSFGRQTKQLHSCSLSDLEQTIDDYDQIMATQIKC